MNALQFIWEKPVLTFYRERFGDPEREAFVAVKARKLILTKKEGAIKYECTLEDFFPIMGKLDQVSTEEGKIDKYVICWFDNTFDDFDKAFRRLTGVTFPDGIKCVTDEKGKILCQANFEAKQGKLK